MQYIVTCARTPHMCTPLASSGTAPRDFGATRWRTRSESELSLRALGEAALKPNASPMGSLAYTAVRSVTRRRAQEVLATSCVYDVRNLHYNPSSPLRDRQSNEFIFSCILG